MPIEQRILESMMNLQTKDLFRAFHLVYKKSNAIESDVGRQRMKIFSDNLEYIKKENSIESNTYRLGLTKFSDLTNEELRQKMLLPEIIFSKIKNR